MIRNGLFIAALCCLSWGCYTAWPPLGWIAPSVIVLAILCATELRKHDVS